MNARARKTVMLIADDHEAALGFCETKEVLVRVESGLREVLGNLLPVDLVEAGELGDSMVCLKLGRPRAPVALG